VKLIALEEAFWYDKLATDGSPLSHLPVKPEVIAGWQRWLPDFTEFRLPEMDKYGVDMQVLSLTSPGIQMQPDPEIAVADARTANDFLATVISAHPRRFAGLAAIPLQDPQRAAAELRRAVGAGLCGALVNDHTLGHYLDEPQYAPFWEALQDLDVPLYIHPNAVPSDEWNVVRGYPGLESAAWSWAPRTGGHAMRLIFGGVFDRFPGARIIRRPRPAAAPQEAARGVLRHQHRDHHHRRVLARGTHRRDPGGRHRQRDVLHRLPVRADRESGRVHPHRTTGPGRPGESGARERRTDPPAQAITVMTSAPRRWWR
jgi:2,3-dihydroxybenzoate decarboxylase